MFVMMWLCFLMFNSKTNSNRYVGDNGEKNHLEENMEFYFFQSNILIHLVCPSVCDTTFCCKSIFYVSTTEPAIGKNIVVWNAWLACSLSVVTNRARQGGQGSRCGGPGEVPFLLKKSLGKTRGPASNQTKI
jgi:hypothetical protein